ncbi:MAG: hypothetical protein BGO43_09060 [Gammaproteobacteria bacterium 39-13]|nr:PepSY domain-containing protein [Gammaproteobacteria bacterium]OJV92223.1 MAG: hypothetical protein BGO43_09060 [Gammaproteobacteria bacterium 39-13]
MKNIISASFLLGSFLIVLSPLSLAEGVKTQPGQMDKALSALQDKGYVIVKKIEFNSKNGTFMAKVVNAEGKNLNLQIDPQTGELSKEKGDITGWTAREIAKKVNDAGYDNIYEINTELFGNAYKVKALNDKGEKVSLKVDAKTGKIIKVSE